MKHVLSLLVPALLGASLSAQTGPTLTITTQTPYGVTTEDGTEEVVDGRPANTPITSRLSLRSSVPGALATNQVRSLSGGRLGLGVSVEEHGYVFSRSATASLGAGTIDEAGPAPQHSAPHTLDVVVDNVTATEGTVTIVWSAHASEGAEASCSVDLDDDQVPDFTGEANERPVVQEFRVQRLGRRFLFHITTQGEAEIEGRGWAAYGAGLSLFFREGAANATVTPYGRECGAHLAGTIADGRANLDLSNAPASAFGVLLVGDRAVSLSLGQCTLLTLPMVIVPLRTDAAGVASQSLRLPIGTVDLRVQDLVFASAGLAASNGLRLESR